MDHQDFAQLLGNYGEFVGAIAVVVTLAYLAIQVRYSRAATETNTKQLAAMMQAEMTTHWLSNNNTVANSADLADVMYRTMNEPESVVPAEHIQVLTWSIACLKSGEFSSHQLRTGNLDNALWEGNNALLSGFFAIPTHPWRFHWPNIKHMFTAEYQDYIDSLIPS